MSAKKQRARKRKLSDMRFKFKTESPNGCEGEFHFENGEWRMRISQQTNTGVVEFIETICDRKHVTSVEKQGMSVVMNVGGISHCATFESLSELECFYSAISHYRNQSLPPKSRDILAGDVFDCLKPTNSSLKLLNSVACQEQKCEPACNVSACKADIVNRSQQKVEANDEFENVEFAEDIDMEGPKYVDIGTPAIEKVEHAAEECFNEAPIEAMEQEVQLPLLHMD